MSRRRKDNSQGRFLLFIRTRYGYQYYCESGAYVTPNAPDEPFIYWSKHPGAAHGFRTAKTAGAMIRLLQKEYGIEAEILERKAVSF